MSKRTSSQASDGASRGAWQSKLGFILAASGSAIGLGNIVFFTSNAYQYGGGAFYLPYFVALFVLGIPMMITEFGLGAKTGRSFPEALRQIAGPKGAFTGWWAMGGAMIVVMFYNTILAWALTMMFGALGGLFEAGVTAPFAPFSTPSEGVNSTAYFFNIITTYWPLLAVLAVWALNVLILWRGARSIEAAVRVFVPLMWVFMIGLIVRGLTLDGGVDGVLYLFTPDIDGIADPGVWKGAFAQMFFTLSLGLGTMTAYASYLPKKSDHVNNAFLVSFLNCGFEYIAGFAVFALLFAFALNPAGSTLTLSFFAIPQGIAGFPWGVQLFGFLFFFLLVIAGITSSISIIESVASALIDTLRWKRAKALALIAVPGIIGSLCMATPQIIDPGLDGNGTLGLSLLDVVSHWSFDYSLITTGFVTSILVGWVLGPEKLRVVLNEHSRLKLGGLFDVLIKFCAPILLGTVLLWSLYDEIASGAFYGSNAVPDAYQWIPVIGPVIWLGAAFGLAFYMSTRSSTSRHEPGTEAEDESVNTAVLP